MKAIITNKFTVIQSPSESVVRALKTLMSYTDKQKAYQLRRLKNNPFQRNSGYVKKLEKEGLSELKNIQYFYESVPEFAGTFAGIGMMYFFNQRKPVLTLTKTAKDIKVSGRGTKRLVDRGLDIAIILSKVATELGGTGGGHNVAAGATIPLETEKRFLEMVDKLVGEQLNDELGD